MNDFLNNKNYDIDEIIETVEKLHEKDRFSKIINLIEKIPAENRGYTLTKKLAKAYCNLGVLGDNCKNNNSDIVETKHILTCLDMLKTIEKEGQSDHEWHKHMANAYLMVDDFSFDLAITHAKKWVELNPKDKQEAEQFIQDCYEYKADVEKQYGYSTTYEHQVELHKLKNTNPTTKNNDITDRVIDSIHALIENGATFCVATGRAIISAQRFLKKIGIEKCYAVCTNGGVVVELNPEHENGYKILSKITFKPQRILKTLHEKMPDSYLCVENTGVGFYVNKIFPPNTIIGEQKIKTIEELGQIETAKVILDMPEYSNAQLREIIAQTDMTGVEHSFGKTAWMDITPEGVTKQIGLKFLCEHLGFERQNTFVIGDGDNDITMFEWAGHSTAMENALPELKEKATTQTKTVHEDGAALVFEELLERSSKNQ